MSERANPIGFLIVACLQVIGGAVNIVSFFVWGDGVRLYIGLFLLAMSVPSILNYRQAKRRWAR